MHATPNPTCETETPPAQPLETTAASANDALMLDIETMSTKSNAAILTIGATVFNPYGIDDEDTLRKQSMLFGPISLESNEAAERHFSAGTIGWWLQQSEAAQRALVEGAPAGLPHVLSNMIKWINTLNPKPKEVWANSPSFDLVILKDAFEYLDFLWPFHFSHERDVRTVKADAYPDGNCPDIQIGTAHDAVDDTIKQSIIVQHCKGVIEGRIRAYEELR